MDHRWQCSEEQPDEPWPEPTTDEEADAQPQGAMPIQPKMDETARDAAAREPRLTVAQPVVAQH